VKGSRETTGEGEGIANRRWIIISDMIAKEKAVGKSTRASVKADVTPYIYKLEESRPTDCAKFLEKTFY
jgi:hypothetical protein